VLSHVQPSLDPHATARVDASAAHSKGLISIYLASCSGILVGDFHASNAITVDSEGEMEMKSQSNLPALASLIGSRDYIGQQIEVVVISGCQTYGPRCMNCTIRHFRADEMCLHRGTGAGALWIIYRYQRSTISSATMYELYHTSLSC
jgi:hypothetical protein